MARLEVHNLKKIYTTRFGGNQVQALSDVSFDLESGEFVAVMGNPAPERRRFSTFWRPWTGPPPARSF